MRKFWIQFDSDKEPMSATSLSAYCEEVNQSIASEIPVVDTASVIAELEKIQAELPPSNFRAGRRILRLIEELKK